MRSATELLVQYAAYHRDRRNILSHFVGVPLIVFGVAALLARPVLGAGGVALTPAGIAVILASAWWLTRGSALLGAATSVAAGAIVWLAAHVAHGSVSVGLTWGASVFVVGWLFQLVGHVYEGRKPAFVDDLVGLLVGPMFIVAEALFQLGWNKPLQVEIERRAGPTVLRDLARIA